MVGGRVMAGRTWRWSAALAGVAMASTLAGCGATMNEAVIGVPAHITPSAVRSASDPPAGANLQNFVNELNQAATAQTGPESSQLITALRALSNDRALIDAEKGDVLKQFAAHQIGVRQALVASLIANVQARPRVSAGQRAMVISSLRAVSAHLATLGSVISADTLVDRLRGEIASITPESQIYTIVQGVNHPAAP